MGTTANVETETLLSEGVEHMQDTTAFDASAPSYGMTKWIVDTGATSHMTPHRDWFTKYKPDRRPIRLANNHVVYSEGIGTVSFQPIVDGKLVQTLEFSRVLHVPDLKNNLLSALFLTRSKEFIVTITANTVLFQRDKQTLFTATVNHYNSATLIGYVLVPASALATFTQSYPTDWSLWHRCLAHLNHADVQLLHNERLVKGMDVKSKTLPAAICEPCLAGKLHRTHVPKTAQTRATALLQLVHSDVHGPIRTQSRHGYKYWITFIDDYSRTWFVHPLKKKSDAFDAFKHFVVYAENQLGSCIKALRDDKGGEYMSKAWDDFCVTKGIHRQHTVRNEPHQNGVAERANRTISEGITAMLNEAHLPESFWWDAVAAFVHTRNRSPTSANAKSATPLSLWSKVKPDINHLRVFGCTAYVNLQKDQRGQLEAHYIKCIFIGYPHNYKGWRFWNPVTQKEIISNSAVFDESKFPGNSRTPIDLRIPALDDPDQGGLQYFIDNSDNDDDLFPPAPPDVIPHSPAS